MSHLCFFLFLLIETRNATKNLVNIYLLTSRLVSNAYVKSGVILLDEGIFNNSGLKLAFTHLIHTKSLK